MDWATSGPRKTDNVTTVVLLVARSSECSTPRRCHGTFEPLSRLRRKTCGHHAGLPSRLHDAYAYPIGAEGLGHLPLTASIGSMLHLEGQEVKGKGLLMRVERKGGQQHPKSTLDPEAKRSTW